MDSSYGRGLLCSRPGRHHAALVGAHIACASAHTARLPRSKSTPTPSDWGFFCRTIRPPRKVCSAGIPHLPSRSPHGRLAPPREHGPIRVRLAPTPRREPAHQRRAFGCGRGAPNRAAPARSSHPRNLALLAFVRQNPRQSRSSAFRHEIVLLGHVEQHLLQRRISLCCCGLAQIIGGSCQCAGSSITDAIKGSPALSESVCCPTETCVRVRRFHVLRFLAPQSQCRTGRLYEARADKPAAASACCVA